MRKNDTTFTRRQLEFLTLDKDELETNRLRAGAPALRPLHVGEQLVWLRQPFDYDSTRYAFIAEVVYVSKSSDQVKVEVGGKRYWTARIWLREMREVRVCPCCGAKKVVA